MAEETRDRLIEISAAMLADRGYEGVSIREIAASLNLRTAAVFYHFPSKAELVAATLVRSKDWLTGTFAEIEAAHIEPRAAIEAFVAWFGSYKWARREFCLAGVMAAARGGLPAIVTAEMERVTVTITEWFAGRLAMAYPESDPTALARRAEALLALIEGALLVSRMRDRPASYAEITDLALPSLLHGQAA